MDENSSDSICSDDTEYLLGQNVSIRDIDEVEEPSSKTPASKHKGGQYLPSQQYNVDIDPVSRGNVKKVGHINNQQDNRKSSQKLQTSYFQKHSKNVNFQHQQKYDPPSNKASTDVILDSHKNQKGVKQSSTRTHNGSKMHPQISSPRKFEPSSKSAQETKTTMNRYAYEGGNVQQEDIHFAQKGNPIKARDTKIDKVKGWREGNLQDNVLEWNQNNERPTFDSPEQVDIVSIASEATEELLKEDELDGSIIQKLKELNLAVSYDCETQELSDDKVREGAQLLSKLFGGNIDDYYSSTSIHSGSASGQEISRGESETEEKRNISNVSSKGSAMSLSNILTPPHQYDEPKRGSDRRPKVSFATDDSISFETSSPSSRNKLTEQFKKSPVQRDDVSYKTNSHNGFIRETSALRAAMDYGGDDDDDDDNAKSREYSEQMYKQNHTGMYPTGINENRFAVERYSESTRVRSKEGAAVLDIEPLWDGYLTSTPHKTTDQASPGSQINRNDIKTKLHLEKKLQEIESKLNQSTQELKDIQLEVEGALLKKKVALGEIQILEDQLKRNKVDVKTSDNLAEQYNQQVTKTRSELMDLEVERDSARQDIKDMENLLTKQKQEMSEAFKVEKKSERKAMELFLENSKLQRELDTLQAKFSQSETTLVNEKKLFLEKIGMLQEELQGEKRTNKENIQRLKQQLEEERQIARSSHYERIQSIHKFQDEAKETQQKEIEAVKTRLIREHELQLDKSQEKSKREIDTLSRNIKDEEFRISQLNCTLIARDEELEKLKAQLLDGEQKWSDTSLLFKEEITKHEGYALALKAEVDSLKEREISLTSSNRTLEQSLDDKTHEVRRLKDQLQKLVEESSKVEENKQDEIQMLRSLVRQQEDATRMLGEKMRTEAQEQIRTALKKEREVVDKEREKQKEKLSEIKENYDDILNQLRGELEDERRGHQQLQTTALKLKREVDELRERNLRTQEEKVAQIAQLRMESKQQIIKLKDKIQELSLVTDRNEKDFVLEINEECRRVASLIGGSPNTTPIKSVNLSNSFTGSIMEDSPGSNSPAREALANLKSCNAELRQHLLEARKEIETQKTDSFKKQSENSELTQQQISIFKKALKSKDDEIARLKRHLQEDTNHNASTYKSERIIMQKTIERLEKELKETKKLLPASSPITNGHSFTDSTTTSGLGTSFSPGTSRSGEDSSSARLLRHLQGRVQQLRAQNDSLRSDSLNESNSSAGTADSTYDGADDTQLTKKLQSTLQLSDHRANKNAAMLNQKMLEMTKLQKMLTHATKENMKLERAYASLQKKMIDQSLTSS